MYESLLVLIMIGAILKLIAPGLKPKKFTPEQEERRKQLKALPDNHPVKRQVLAQQSRQLHMKQKGTFRIVAYSLVLVGFLGALSGAKFPLIGKLVPTLPKMYNSISGNDDRAKANLMAENHDKALESAKIFSNNRPRYQVLSCDKTHDKNDGNVQCNFRDTVKDKNVSRNCSTITPGKCREKNNFFNLPNPAGFFKHLDKELKKIGK